jgi:hypothetical protein
MSIGIILFGGVLAFIVFGVVGAVAYESWQTRRSAKPVALGQMPSRATEHPSGLKADFSPKAANAFSERDNRGTRHDTREFANAYWLARMGSAKKDPFVLYTFATQDDARKALLELPCIHLAQDTRTHPIHDLERFSGVVEFGLWEGVRVGRRA